MWNSTRPGIVNYCECLDDCDASCDLANESTAYFVVGLVFACWYVVTMVNCVYQIRERSQLDVKHAMPPPPPMVPSLLNTLQNKTFTVLLPAWVCDAVVNAIIASMITYFVRYVVRPEYQTMEEHGINCNEGRSVEGEDSSSWRCDSSLVLGMSVTSLLCAAFAGSPIWLMLTKWIGKRNAWLLWSVVQALTNLLYLLVDKGDVNLCVAISAINGFPFGAKFLSDAILADIIDYDEFLSGARNEATYTMFKSFLPKIAAIPASALPLAALNALGHIAPVDGRPQIQKDIIAPYVQCVIVIFPACLSVLGAFLKTRFPIKTKEQVAKIGEGVGRHLIGRGARDPISGQVYHLMHLEAEETDDYYRLGNFLGLEPLELLMQEGGALKLQASMYKYWCLAFSFLILMLALSCVTFDMLNSTVSSVVPVLCIIGFGGSLTISIFSYLRYKAAVHIVEKPVSRSLIERVKNHREKVLNMRVSDSGKVGAEDLEGNEESELYKENGGGIGGGSPSILIGMVGGKADGEEKQDDESKAGEEESKRGSEGSVLEKGKAAGDDGMGGKKPDTGVAGEEAIITPIENPSAEEESDSKAVVGETRVVGSTSSGEKQQEGDSNTSTTLVPDDGFPKGVTPP